MSKRAPFSAALTRISQQQVSASPLSSAPPPRLPLQGSILYSPPVNGIPNLPSGLSLHDIKKGHLYWQPFGSWLPLEQRGRKKQNTRRTTALAPDSCRERPSLIPCLPRSWERSEKQVHLHSRTEWSPTVGGRGVSPQLHAQHISLQRSVEGIPFTTPDFPVLENTLIPFQWCAQVTCF